MPSFTIVSAAGLDLGTWTGATPGEAPDLPYDDVRRDLGLE